MKIIDALIVILLIIVLVLFTLGIIDSYNAPNEIQEIEDTSNVDFDYSIIDVEGMPCLILENWGSHGEHGYSITCDWDKNGD